MSVSEALRKRISTRAFLPTPVPETLVREILDVARRAPSGGNVQPWKVMAVAGEDRQNVIDIAAQVTQTNPAGEVGERFIYPDNLWEPHRSWRYKLGEDMYALLGIPKENKLGRLAHLARNAEFFGAPVGLFFIIDERMGFGQWAHLGMFMQSIALAALERGVASCMQEFWARYRTSLKAHFQLPETEMIYCAMALGYADESAAVNTLYADRAEVDEFATFRGF
ncbi:MAG: nitroreductase [Alphaproteobacteria bacterium]|nr:nitroreductase [Alphaproteobacteria bacterium]